MIDLKLWNEEDGAMTFPMVPSAVDAYIWCKLFKELATRDDQQPCSTSAFWTGSVHVTTGKKKTGSVQLLYAKDYVLRSLWQMFSKICGIIKFSKQPEAPAVRVSPRPSWIRRSSPKEKQRPEALFSSWWDDDKHCIDMKYLKIEVY